MRERIAPMYETGFLNFFLRIMQYNLLEYNLLLGAVDRIRAPSIF